jgi:hypothetical protein
LQFVLQQRACTFGLTFGSEKPGKTVRRAQRKSALATLAGEGKRLFEVSFSKRRIIDLSVRGKAPFDTKALDFVPVVTTPPEDVARLVETKPGFRQLVRAHSDDGKSGCVLSTAVATGGSNNAANFVQSMGSGFDPNTHRWQKNDGGRFGGVLLE